MQRGVAIGVGAIVTCRDDVTRAQALQGDAPQILTDGRAQAKRGRVVHRSDDEPLTFFGERDHRAVGAGERGRFTRDQARELFERKLAGRGETDVVEDGELLGAAALALAKLPVRVQREAGTRREDEHGKGNGAVNQVGEPPGDPLDVGVDEQERACRGDDAGQDHAREVNGRAGEPAVPTVLAVLDPLRARDSDGPDAEEPEGIDRRPGLEGARDVRGQIEHERKSVEAKAEEERRDRATRLGPRHPPYRRERSRGRRDVEQRVEHRDRRGLGIAGHIGREGRREEQRHRRDQRQDDRADIEDEGVERELLTVPAKQQDQGDRPHRRRGHETKIHDEG